MHYLINVLEASYKYLKRFKELKNYYFSFYYYYYYKKNLSYKILKIHNKWILFSL